MLRQDATNSLFVGIDMSVKHDSTALVAVKSNDRFGEDWCSPLIKSRCRALAIRWIFEATIEFYPRRLEGYQTRIEKIMGDRSRCTEPLLHGTCRPSH